MKLRIGAGTVSRAVVALTAVSLIVAAPAAAKRVRVGTPYAAEVSAGIIGTADISYSGDQTTYFVCEDQSSESKVAETFSFDWAVNYPHVTVPVADARELGKAYKRLHVPAQPTSEGHGGLTTGEYDISGSGPPTTEGNQPAGGSDCTQKPYGASGKFYGLGVPDFVHTDVTGFFGDRQHMYLFTMPPLFARPASYQDNLGNTVNVYDDLTTAADDIPAPNNVLATQPSWNSVPADFSIGELKRLVHRSKVTLHPNVYSGKQDCSQGSNDTGSDVCTVSWTFRWTVTLHKKFLYKTKPSHKR